MYTLMIWNGFIPTAKLRIYGRDILTLLKYAQKLGLSASVDGNRDTLYILDGNGRLQKITLQMAMGR